LWNDARIRVIEAHAATRFMNSIFGVHATSFANQSIMWLHANEPGTFGLEITATCTSAYFLAGFLILSAVLALSGRFRATRLVAALAAGMLVVFVINVTRLAVIGLASSVWGRDAGFTASHVYAGSVMTIVGAAGSVAAYLWLLLRRQTRASSRGGVR
jgi:exosortase/archaeosortase family protein